MIRGIISILIFLLPARAFPQTAVRVGAFPNIIIAIGYIVDGLVFKNVERRIQKRWGLAPA